MIIDDYLEKLSCIYDVTITTPCKLVFPKNNIFYVKTIKNLPAPLNRILLIAINKLSLYIKKHFTHLYSSNLFFRKQFIICKSKTHMRVNFFYIIKKVEQKNSCFYSILAQNLVLPNCEESEKFLSKLLPLVIKQNNHINHDT